MDANLLAALKGALADLLEGFLRKDLAASATGLSLAYRRGENSQYIRSDADAITYCVVRMPATFAACMAAFEQAHQSLPQMAPLSLLDLGAGTGAASWAALTVWPELQLLRCGTTILV